jgi:hypothetical protein
MHAEALYNYIEGALKFYGAGANNLPPIVSIGYNNKAHKILGAGRGNKGCNNLGPGG